MPVGSTSQAASILEAVEVGAAALLLDEDTSATNFMVRDARMQALVHKEHEPITPFVDRVRGVIRTARRIHGIGDGKGCGDYFDVADTVIAMQDYQPFDVTEDAQTHRTRVPDPYGPSKRLRLYPKSRPEYRYGRVSILPGANAT